MKKFTPESVVDILVKSFLKKESLEYLKQGKFQCYREYQRLRHCWYAIWSHNTDSNVSQLVSAVDCQFDSMKSEDIERTLSMIELAFANLLDGTIPVEHYLRSALENTQQQN